VLLVGFFAGAWVDRLRRRPLLISADAVRAVLLFSIPAAYLAGALRIEQLYLVVFLEGCFGALFDAAYPAYVPLPHRGRSRGRGQQQARDELRPWPRSVVPAWGAALVQLIGAPFAILVDAISFVVSAITLMLIHSPEAPRPARTLAHTDATGDHGGPPTRPPASGSSYR